jgi:hypothetical protein
MHVEVQDTAFNKAPVVLRGLGVVTIDHEVPFHVSANVKFMRLASE